MAAPILLTEIDGAGVGWITLNRPEALNAVTIELAVALDEALVGLEPDCGAIVVRGAGEHFCVGGDFPALQALRAEGPAALAELFERFGRALERIGELEVPVIASVHGYAMAGGFELAQAADVVVVAQDARLADNHANFGMVPGGGGSQRLPRLVGRQRASALILTGGRLSGADAVAWGLAHQAVPSAELARATTKLATLLAGRERTAQARTKRLIRDGLALSLEDGLALEREVVVDHLTGEAAGAGIALFTDRGGR